MMKTQVATALSGVFAVYKPRGVGSTDVVTKVRTCIENHLLQASRHPAAGLVGQQPLSQTLVSSSSGSSGKALLRRRRGKPLVKVGHGGTLDPLAEGVLVVGLGDSCSELSNFLFGGKSYVAVGQLGVRTDTCDATGAVVETAAWDHVTLDALQQRLPDFRGEVQQVPPLFSALKRNGKRLYDYARDGTADALDIKARTVCVHDIDVVAADDVPGYVVHRAPVTADTVDPPPLLTAAPYRTASSLSSPSSPSPTPTPASSSPLSVATSAGVGITVEQATAFGMTARFLPRSSARLPTGSSSNEGGGGEREQLQLPLFGLLAVVGGGT